MGNGKKPPLEAVISKKILKELRSIRGCWAEKVPGGFFSSGKPDITGCYYGRRFDFEVKRTAKQEPTKLQQWNLDRWDVAGGITGTVTCVGDVLDILSGVAQIIYRSEAEIAAQKQVKGGKD